MLEEKKMFIDLFVDDNIRADFNTFNDWDAKKPAANGLRNNVSVKIGTGYIYKKDDDKHARYWEINGTVSNQVTIKSLKDWSAVKTIAFTPGVIVPRYKLQKLKETTGLSVVRDMAKADAVITSLRSIQDYVDKFTELGQCITTAVLLRDFITDYNASLKIPGMMNVLGVLNSVPPDTEILIKETLTKFISYYHITETQSDKRYNGHSSKHITSRNTWPGIFTQEGKDKLAELSKYNLINETDLNALLGESVLDADAYDMITKMIQSDNVDDRNVAISIVGNCNFVDSYKYGLAWFIKNIDKIMMCRQPVAFKAFRTFIGYEKIYKKKDKYHFHIDQIMQAALSNRVYHDGFMEEIMQIDDLPIEWTGSKLIKPVKFDITQEGKDIISSVNQPI